MTQKETCLRKQASLYLRHIRRKKTQVTMVRCLTTFELLNYLIYSKFLWLLENVFGNKLV